MVVRSHWVVADLKEDADRKGVLAGPRAMVIRRVHARAHWVVADLKEEADRKEEVAANGSAASWGRVED